MNQIVNKQSYKNRSCNSIFKPFLYSFPLSFFSTQYHVDHLESASSLSFQVSFVCHSFGMSRDYIQFSILHNRR